MLDQQTTGIIISVEKDTCRVLTTEVSSAASLMLLQAEERSPMVLAS